VETLLRDTMAERGVRVGDSGINGEVLVQRGQRVRRVRRWGTVLGVVVVVSGLLVGGIGVGSSLRHPAAVAPVTGGVSKSPPKAALLLLRELSLPGGKTITLPDGHMYGSWMLAPVAGGWVAYTGGTAVLVSPAGKITPLAQSTDSDMLAATPSPDGTKVAVSTDNGKGVGRVRIFDVRTRHVVGSTPVANPNPLEGTFQNWVQGWSGNSLVLGIASYKELAKVGLWDPTAGAWNGVTTQKMGIVQGIADGGRLLGYTQDPQGRVCLGFIDPANGFGMSATRCDFQADPQEGPPLVSLAPGGKAIVISDRAGNFLESATISGDDILPGTEKLSQPPNFQTTGLVWEDSDTVLAIGNPPSTPNDAVLRCSISAGTCTGLGVKIPTTADLGQFSAAALVPQAAK
jgi:hypothetical protein